MANVTFGTYAGQITYLNSNCFALIESQMKTMKSTLGSVKNKMKSSSTTLLDTWEGKGANQFETEYILLRQELEDLYDEIGDLYDRLLSAQQQYEAADQQTASAISSN